MDKRLILQWDYVSLLIKSASSTGAQRAQRPTTQTSSRYPFLQVMLELCCGFVMVLMVLLCGCSRCDGKQMCEVNMRVNHISDPCYGTYKYLDVTYICLPARQYSPSGALPLLSNGLVVHLIPRTGCCSLPFHFWHLYCTCTVDNNLLVVSSEQLVNWNVLVHDTK